MRIVLTVITIALCTLVTPTYANTDRAADVEQELRKLVQTWDEAFVKKDTETLDRLLADEFEFVGGPKKADYLASTKTRKANILSAVSSDVRVQVYDDMAIVTGLDANTGRIGIIPEGMRLCIIKMMSSHRFSPFEMVDLVHK